MTNQVVLPRIKNLGACDRKSARIVARNADLIVMETLFSGDLRTELLYQREGKHGRTDLIHSAVKLAALSPKNEYAFLLAPNGGYVFRLTGHSPEKLLEAHVFKGLPADIASAAAISDDGVIAIGTPMGYLHTYAVDGYPIHDDSYAGSAGIVDLAFHGKHLHVINHNRVPRVLEFS